MAREYEYYDKEKHGEAYDKIMQEYHDIFWNTQPADRGLMQQAICSVYGQARLPMPTKFLWCDNPEQYQKVTSALIGLYENRHYEEGSYSYRRFEAVDWTEAPYNMVQNPETVFSSLKEIISDRASLSLPSSSYNYFYNLPHFVDTDRISDVIRLSQPGNSGSASSFRGHLSSFGSMMTQELASVTNPDQTKERYMLALKTLKSLAKAGSFWHPFEGLVVCLERPTAMHFNNQNRLHNESGPALEYPSGYELYCLNGISVGETLVMRPQDQTIEEIADEPNQEIRSLRLRLFGIDKFIERSGATLINYDSKFGRLWLCDRLKVQRGWHRYPRSGPNMEPFVYIQVTNSTPEPDGTYKQHFIRVPPRYKTAKGAVAWTLQQRRNDYNPVIET